MLFVLLFTVGCFAYDINGMLQLDFIKNDGTFADRETTWKELVLTKEMGFDGVMCDVWWGIVETAPQVYKFDVYLDLVKMVHELGLKFQPVMSFHQCGGNVGDTCNIPIPEWVRKQAKEKKAGFYLYDGKENLEYLNFAADDLPLDDKGRTPIQMYYEFMKAFNDQFKTYIELGTIDEIQVGTGPCGETRYPAYAATMGWEYPAIGEFTVNDPYSMRSLEMAAFEADHPEWYGIPKGLGNVKTKKPDDEEATFFHKEYKDSYGEDHFSKPKGQFFMKWYATLMVKHTDRVLAEARRAFGTKMPLANKVAGIHWWFEHPSRAGEATSGYVVLTDANKQETFNTYTELSKVFKKHGSRMTFTCMEMTKNNDFDSNPPALIEYVFKSAPGVELRGENALEVVGCNNFGSGADAGEEFWINDLSFAQLKKQMTEQTRLTGITLLRLQKYIFAYKGGVDSFSELTAHAKKCGAKGKDFEACKEQAKE